MGEELLSSGDEEGGIEHISNAVAVCGSPQQLLSVLQQTLPPPIFAKLVQKLSEVPGPHVPLPYKYIDIIRYIALKKTLSYNVFLMRQIFELRHSPSSVFLICHRYNSTTSIQIQRTPPIAMKEMEDETHPEPEGEAA